MSEEQKVVYSQRVEEISPNMRYCAYNIGDMPTDINQLMEMRNVSDMLASKINVKTLAPYFFSIKPMIKYNCNLVQNLAG